MRQHILTSLAAVLILLGGAVHGYMTHRWARPVEIRRAVAFLPRLPLRIGEWDGSDVQPNPDQLRQLDKAECDAWLMRRYVNQRTGEAVSLLAVCGRPGPIATHDPRACYGASGINQVGSIDRQAFPAAGGAEEAAFWSGIFHQTGSVSPMSLSIAWSFRARDRWEAPDDPRVASAGYRALYKIYVIREIALNDGRAVQDPVSRQFIQALLPALERTVFPRSTAARSACHAHASNVRTVYS
jgi:hypothetical protein